jgi:hypothetical protein
MQSFRPQHNDFFHIIPSFYYAPDFSVTRASCLALVSDEEVHRAKMPHRAVSTVLTLMYIVMLFILITLCLLLPH